MSTEESKKPVISTKCPKCGQVVRFYSPGHEGVVKVKCSFTFALGNKFKRIG